MQNIAIQVRDLQKSYKALHVLKGVDFEVEKGSIFALLGSNGAGKTTIVKILTTLLKADGGSAFVNGLEVVSDSFAVRQSISLTGQFAAVDEILTGRENLVMIARLRHLQDVRQVAEELLKRFGLTDAADRRVATYSGGMRRRLDIAMSLIGKPQIIFLDEPTAGLDPEASKLVRDFIDELKTEGRTIFLCTHNLDEADRLCNRIGVFKQHLIQVDTPSRMKTAVFGRQVEFKIKPNDAQLAEIIKRFPFIKSTQVESNRLLLGLDNPEESNPLVVKALVNAGVEVQFVSEVRHSLEDVYLSLINNGTTR